MNSFFKKLFISFLPLIICAALVTGTKKANAEELYFPLTVEKAENAWNTTRDVFFDEELKDSKWEDRIKVILTGFDATNSYDYRASVYGVHSAENFVAIASPAWPLSVQYEDGEYPWTIPDEIYEHKCIPLYWVMNADVLNTMLGDDDLIGLILHELVHIYDQDPKVSFTEKTCIISPRQTPLTYASREKLNDAYLFATKGHLGCVIPMYRFARWAWDILPPIFGITEYPIPIEHPFINYLTLTQTWTPDEIKTFFFRPVEAALQKGVVLDEKMSEAYEYLMNN